jgi:hypothetical protein
VAGNRTGRLDNGIDDKAVLSGKSDHAFCFKVKHHKKQAAAAQQQKPNKNQTTNCYEKSIFHSFLNCLFIY